MRWIKEWEEWQEWEELWIIFAFNIINNINNININLFFFLVVVLWCCIKMVDIGELVNWWIGELVNVGWVDNKYS